MQICMSWLGIKNIHSSEKKVPHLIVINVNKWSIKSLTDWTRVECGKIDNGGIGCTDKPENWQKVTEPHLVIQICSLAS